MNPYQAPQTIDAKGESDVIQLLLFLIVFGLWTIGFPLYMIVIAFPEIARPVTLLGQIIYIIFCLIVSSFWAFFISAVFVYALQGRFAFSMI